MDKKSKFVIALLLILSAILVFVIISKTKTDTFETEVYKTETGYGYSISFRNTLLIKQDYIPAIQNNVSFYTEEDAQKVANLVKEKLGKKMNPKISLLELKQLGITLNGIN
ncbi:uncharacterized protein DUF4907 [Mariniflexile fucanivorans]|uniref:Uncharacterized protein DUF4907 n=1 Tax=Mariniflexile fucanivorans TaxID=264023 RepID=A0A4R1RL43_9FLAO|nr:DUF4907 domain-containing protein [Mariniflexile fucanivorans]TCL66931.1 uncharacterized protein DUF4907 [Mariniflexile fucanivorans]